MRWGGCEVGMGLGPCVVDTEVDQSTFWPGSMLSHRPLIRLQRCGIYLISHEKKNQYFSIISNGVLNLLYHISLHRPRKRRGKGQESTP